MINTAMLDELENTKTETAVNPQDYLIQSQPVQSAEPPIIKKPRGINMALLDAYEQNQHQDIIANKAKVVQPNTNLVVALQKKPEQPKPSIIETGTPEPPEQTESPMQTQIRRAAANVPADPQSGMAQNIQQPLPADGLKPNKIDSAIQTGTQAVADVASKAKKEWDTIVKATKIAYNQPYKAGEIHDIVSNMMTRTFSPLAYLMPGVSHKDLIAELDKEAEGFSGFGGAVVPAAGKIGKQAVELYAFQKAFGTVSAGAKLLGKMPAVSKVAEAINKMGGVRQFSEKFPHIFQATKSGLKEFAVGNVVGQGFGYLRGKDEGLSGAELFKEMQKKGAVAGLYAGVFSVAGSRDRYNYVKSLRTEMTKRFDVQLQEQVARMPKGKYVNVGTPEKPKMLFKKGVSPTDLSEFRQSGLKYIDDTVAAVDSDLINFAKGNLYPNIRDKVVNISPAKAAERFMKYGFERPQYGKPESQSRPAPKAPKSLKTGMGTSKPMEIDQPFTRVGEIAQAVARPIETAKGIIKDIRTELRLPTKSFKQPPVAPPAGQTAIPPITIAKQGEVAANAKTDVVKPLMGYVKAEKNANDKYEVKMGTNAPDNPFNNKKFTGEFDTPQIARKSYEAWFLKQQSTTPADAKTPAGAIVDTAQKQPWEMTKAEF